MSNTYTPNLGLAIPEAGDRNWNVPLSADVVLLDGLAPVGALGVQLTEVPSSSLHVKIAAGNYEKQDGSIASYAGTASTAVAASSTNYLYLDLTAAGVLAVTTGGWPASAHVRIAVVVAASSTITSIADARIAFAVMGTFAEGVNIQVGTTTGTQIATATNQKLGFFGKGPIVQPVMGAATATGTYGSGEQAMLQVVYNAVRSLGLGS